MMYSLKGKMRFKVNTLKQRQSTRYHWISFIGSTADIAVMLSATMSWSRHEILQYRATEVSAFSWWQMVFLVCWERECLIHIHCRQLLPLLLTFNPMLRGPDLQPPLLALRYSIRILDFWQPGIEVKQKLERMSFLPSLYYTQATLPASAINI